MIDALLNFDFIRYSLISGLLIGFIAPLIGAFIVVRRLSLIADALSHVTLGGISFGMFLLTIIPVFSVINPMWFGILFAVIGALLIEKLRTSFSNYQEIAIPIIMSAGIALSAIFISLADGFNQEIVGLLFGSISAVNISDLTTKVDSIFIYSNCCYGNICINESCRYIISKRVNNSSYSNFNENN